MIGIIFLIISYLLGSLSSAIIISKIMKTEDPRKVGSGNAGATNVLRNSGKKSASVVVAGDIAKGFIAVILARFFGVEGTMLGFVALAAVIGHIFPIFFEFKGGKGVATALGALLGLNVFVGILVAIIWIITTQYSKYASLGSIIASVASLPLILFISQTSYLLPCFLITVIILIKHSDNIKRLKNKTESKIKL